MRTARLPAEPAQILVVGPAWVGDMVMAQSLFMLIKAREPAAVIDVVGPPWSVPLVARMPEVRRGIALDVAHGALSLGRRRRLGRTLRGEGYTRAIVLPRSFKSALVPYFAGVARRTGHAAEWRRLLLNDVRRLDRTALDQTVKRYLALGLPRGEALPPVPVPRLVIDEDNRAALLGRLGIGGRPAVALMPGAAYGPAKQWPTAHFAELARELCRRGHEVWLLGAAGERELAAQIRAMAGEGVHDLCGRTTLVDTVDLLSATRAAVSNDSGLMHVAAAAGTHVVGLYGSSSPHRTPPLGERTTIHWLALDCSPCFRRECPLGHLDCLRRIAPQDVLQGLDGVLAPAGGEPPP